MTADGRVRIVKPNGTASPWMHTSFDLSADFVVRNTQAVTFTALTHRPKWWPVPTERFRLEMESLDGSVAMVVSPDFGPIEKVYRGCSVSFPTDSIHIVLEAQV